MITILDYGAGNLASLEGALSRQGLAHQRAASPAEDAGGPLLLPGVGHFGAAKRALKTSGWWDALPALAEERPLLGICLGLLSGTARHLGPGVKVPHMGWSRVQALTGHPAAEGAHGAWLYFVHSYALDIGPDTLLRAEHGRPFTAMAGRGRVLGIQPHPEKSAQDGLRLLDRTLAWMMEPA